MVQEKILIDGYEIVQPDTMEPNWETTYTEDSGRVMSGKAYTDPMFTVESYSFEVTELTPEEAKEILTRIVPRPSKPTFKLHYFSWFYGKWRTDEFYVGKGSLKCKTLEVDHEILESISCNLIGVNPI